MKIAFANQLRGIAALIVVVAHYTGSFWYARAVVPVLTGLPAAPESIATPAISYWTTIAVLPISFGPLGVAIFFLISGFVIPFAFEKQTRLQFAIGRLFRIWPTYFFGFLIGVAFVAVSAHLMHATAPFDAKDVLFHSIAGLREPLGIQPIDGIVWTLEVEIKFYLLAILIAPFLKDRSLITFAAPLALLLTSRLGAPQAIVFATPYLIFMFIGVAFNFSYRGQSLPVTGAIIAMLASAAMVSSDATFPYQSYGLALMIFAFAMVFRDSIPNPKWLSFLADISYPLYVTHALVGYTLMSVLSAYGVGGNLTMLIALVVAIGVASATHILVETRSNDLGGAIRKMMTTPISEPSSSQPASPYT